MTDQKLMVRSKYEKYSSCLATCRRSNKLSKTHDSVKKHRSIYTFEKDKIIRGA